MNNLDKQYQALLQDILDNGVTKSDRTGTGTLSVFGRQIRHKMSEGFPLLTTKKMAWKVMVTELLWFLKGDTNIKYLVDNNCHIWDGDCFANYQKEFKKLYYHTAQMDKEEFINKIKTDAEFAKKWGDLGSIYGHQWRSWTNYTGDEITEGTYEMTNEPIDQIANLINDLKTNPDSRRLMANAWNVGELDQMVLPPCHYGFQVYTRELSVKERMEIYFEQHPDWAMIGEHSFFDKHKIPTRAISLMWNQRSVDTFLGLPFNIASYGLLLELIAKSVNMVPDELIGNLGDTHLYSNHVDQAREQIGHLLSDEERYNLWFDLNYETGMERFYDPERLPDYDNEYWKPTPTQSRQPYPLAKLNINTEFWSYEGGECGEGPLDAVAIFNSFKDDNFCKCLLEEDLQLGNYKSHPAIKAPLSN